MLTPIPPLANGHIYEYRCDHCHRLYDWAQFWLAVTSEGAAV